MQQAAIEAAIIAYDIRRYICIDDFGHSTDEFYQKMEDELIDQSSPESLLLEQEYQTVEKELFGQLSEEAKQVVGIILECPDEIRDIIGGRSGQITIKRLSRYLYRQWEEKRIVRKVLQEIGRYAARLEAYHQGAI